MTAFRHDDPGTSEEYWRASTAWSATRPLGWADLRGVRRVLVLAAHPDDETLGAGGLIHQAAALEPSAAPEVLVLVLTDGEASHPHSLTTQPAHLAELRRRETEAAVAYLHPGAQVRFAGIPDGQLSTQRGQARAEVEAAMEDLGTGVLLVAPYADDGHPDHDTLGQLARDLADSTGAALLEYPIWLWHWGQERDVPWRHCRTVELSPEQLATKRTAIDLHVSQVRPLSDQPGDEVLLTTSIRGHLERATETFIDIGHTCDVDVFERLHHRQADPWRTEVSDYERHRRQVLLDLLPSQRTFAHAYEPGCSIGVLSATLAPRCTRLLAMDASSHAVAAAQERCAALPQVEVRRGRIPADWPREQFDLIVLSEIGYFLSATELDEVIACVRDSLSPDGLVLLGHWRGKIHGWPLDGAQVHDRVEQVLGKPVLHRHTEKDFAAVLLGSGTS